MRLHREIAVDLGTANTVIFESGKGIVLNEPSVAIVFEETGEVVAVGKKAKQQSGRIPGHKAIRPLRDGVIADFEVCAKMLKEFIAMVDIGRMARPRMAICVPTGITPVEKRAVIKVAENAGARKHVYVIEEPVAAAIGAGLPIHESSGSMIVDIGGGTTEVAVLSTGGIVVPASIQVAGNAIDEAILQYIKKEHDFSCALGYVERLKKDWASAWPLKHEQEFKVKGLNLRTGYPAQMSFNTVQMREAVEEPLQRIVDAVKDTLEATPPELGTDIMEKGIVLTGGGCLLHGLPERIQHETNLPVRRAEDPLYSVVKGCGESLIHYKKLRSVLFSANGE